LRYCILRRYRDYHVYMIRHQTLSSIGFLLCCQLAEHFSQMLPQLPVQRLLTALRNEYHVVFAFPSVWLRLSYSSIVIPPLHVLGGSRFGVSPMDSLNYQTSTATPVEPGNLPRWFNADHLAL
jgi:hypothetical protein